MVVRPLCPSDLSALFDIFLRANAGVVHGLPPTEEEFYAAVQTAPAHLRFPNLLVADEGGAIAGFLRAGVFRPVPDRWAHATQGDGMLFGPFFVPEHMQAGQALVDAGLGFLQERRASKAFAFDHIEGVGAPFYNAGWASLSEHVPHIAQLYARAGFRIRAREFCLRRDPDSPIAIPPPAEPPRPLSVVHEVRERGRSAVRLVDRGMFVGACHYSRMFPARGRNPEGMRRGYIDGLSVESSMQGRGFGRLLLIHAIHRLRALGCETISLTTAADNFRAQNLYYSLGFCLVDTCVTFVGSTTARTSR